MTMMMMMTMKMMNDYNDDDNDADDEDDDDNQVVEEFVTVTLNAFFSSFLILISRCSHAAWKHIKKS
jgi:hypothetical protein